MATFSRARIRLSLRGSPHQESVFPLAIARIVTFPPTDLVETHRHVKMERGLIALANLQENVRCTLLGHICQHLIEKGFR